MPDTAHVPGLRRTPRVFKPGTKALVMALSVGIASLGTGCANAPSGSGAGTGFSDIFASDDPCSNNARNIGTVAGGMLGGVLGKLLAKDNRQGERERKNEDRAVFIGIVAGAAIGGFIGADIDRRRCELHRIAKRYELDVESEVIEIAGDEMPADAVSRGGDTSRFDDRIVGAHSLYGARVIKAAHGQSSTPERRRQTIGLSLSLPDKTDGGHFRTGSAELTDHAERYFGEIASQYLPENRLAAAKTDEERQAILKTRIILIGHTDDTGSTRLNADLSERRALSVARYMKSRGIPESMLYFQGAGETLPIADNRTAEGRAKNRRVEIVELANEQALSLYLARRMPRIEYYRVTDTRQPGMRATPRGNDPEPGGKAASTPVRSKPAPHAGLALNLGGIPADGIRADFGEALAPKRGLSLISEARADAPSVISDCSADRPRAAHGVKALRDGRDMSTNQYWPGLYSSSWTDTVNGHLVALNKVAVLRDAGSPARAPEVLIYRDFATGGTKPLPLPSEVNTYRGSKGLLYRVFVPSESAGIQCIDIVFPYRPPFVARDGYIVQERSQTRYAARFLPRIAAP